MRGGDSVPHKWRSVCVVGGRERARARSDGGSAGGCEWQGRRVQQGCVELVGKEE